jgi:hypothetical protein
VVAVGSVRSAVVVAARLVAVAAPLVAAAPLVVAAPLVAVVLAAAEAGVLAVVVAVVGDLFHVSRGTGRVSCYGTWTAAYQ